MTKMTEARDTSRRIDVREFGFHPLSLRLWHGMTLVAWLRVMRGKWHLVSPRRYPLALTVTLFSITNLGLKWLSDALYGSKVAATEIEPAPLFVIGHWRSGTTWLHNMLILDRRHAAPTQAACFCPEFFLVVQNAIKPVIQRFLPEKRPMDNVVIDLDNAEEDEVGICLSGAPSSYASLLFPSEAPILKFDPARDMTPGEAALWRRQWLGFLRRVQFQNPGKRLVLKSPTHSLRIAEILRQFPAAKFIHIRRDPYRVFLSDRHTRRAMESISALQDRLPVRADWKQRQIKDFVAFHETLEADRKNIPEGQFTTVRYEDLRADPLAGLRAIYAALDLGPFSEVETEFETALRAAKPYKTNAFDLDDETRDLIDTEFAAFFELYGYEPMHKRVA